MSSNSTIVTPSTPAEESNKRVVGNTSFDEVPSPESGGPSTKRPNTEQSSELPKKLVTEDFLVATLRTMFAEFETKIDLKFAHIHDRLNSVEEAASSSELRVQDLLTRVEAIERREAEVEQRMVSLGSSVESVRRGETDENWQPVGVPETKILLLGDSNSAGKIKFGQERGTLGRALPGSSQFCPKFENLPPPDSTLYHSVSDVVVSVGTNNIKDELSETEPLVKKVYHYVKDLTRKHPGIHVILPGILPVNRSHTDQALNAKIRCYNHYLKNMCDSLHKTTFVDANIFSDVSGSLKPLLSNGERDPLHLSNAGIRLFASRIKYALRAHHMLPQPVRRPTGPAPGKDSFPGGTEQSAVFVHRGGQGGRWANSHRRDSRGGGFR